MGKNKKIVIWKVLSERLGSMLILIALSSFLSFVCKLGSFSEITGKDLCKFLFAGFCTYGYALAIFNFPLRALHNIPLKFKYNFKQPLEQNSLRMMDNKSYIKR